MVVGNITGLIILKKLTITEEIVIKKKSTEVKGESMTQSLNHCCSCFQEGKEKLIKVCDCVEPERKFHLSCIREEVKRFVTMNLKKKKEKKTFCNFCCKEIKYEKTLKKKCCKKFIAEMLMYVFLLLIWNILVIILNVKILPLDYMFDLQIMGFFSVVNIFFGNILARSIKKGSTEV